MKKAKVDLQKIKNIPSSKTDKKKELLYQNKSIETYKQLNAISFKISLKNLKLFYR